jgi:hypothetical protein
VSDHVSLRSFTIGQHVPTTEVPMSRLHANSSDLEILASALSTIPGSSAIRVRKGQTPSQSDAFQSLLYTLSLMTASQRKARSNRAVPGRRTGVSRRSSAA